MLRVKQIEKTFSEALTDFNLKDKYDFFIVTLQADKGTEATLSLSESGVKSEGNERPEEHYGKFLSYMKDKYEKTCCYAIVNCWYYKNSNLNAKMAMIAWVPDNSDTKSKMSYSSAKKDAMVKLDQQTCHQATDFDELEWKDVLTGNGVKEFGKQK